MTENLVEQIIKQLTTLDLQSEPIEDIYSNIFEMHGILPIIITTINPGTIIIRGRNYNSKENFSLAKSHSYPPAEFVKDYGRANVPRSSIFYGSINPIDDDGPVARITILTEIGKTYRSQADKETIVYSSWEVINPLNVITICSSHLYKSLNPRMVALREEFCHKYSSHPGFKLMELLGNEFAKKVNNNYEYMITSIFSDIVCGCETYDGIYYPGVQVDGAGMNIALKPESVNRCLNFLRACEVDFIREGLNIVEVGRRDIKINDFKID